MPQCSVSQPLCFRNRNQLRQHKPLAIAVGFSLLTTCGLAVAVEETTTLKTVVVSADASEEGLPAPFAGNQVARGGRVGLLGNQERMETPFASTSYTHELIQDQQARSVADVLQNDPGVRIARGFGNFQEVYMVRGFALFSDDIAYNGLYGLLPRQHVASELLERVEVFRGASTFLNGAAPGGSGIGGAINLLPKRAPNEPLTQVTAGIESGGQGYAALDVARRFGDEQGTGIRFNAVRRDGDSTVDDEDHELSVLALGFDFRRDALRVSADIGYQDRHIDAPRPSVTPSGGIPDAPDAGENFAQPWTYTDERQTFGTLRAEYDFDERTTSWAAIGMRRGDEENVLSNPTATADGNTSAYRFDNVRDDEVITGEVGLRTAFETGSLGHTVSVAANSYDLDSRNSYAFSSFAGFAGNLYDPVDVSAPPADALTGGLLASPKTTQETKTSSVAIADTVSVSDGRVLVTLGLRYQVIEDYTYNYDTGARDEAYDESRLTPVGGIVFRVAEQVSLYANYIEGLVRGDTFATTSTTTSTVQGATFEPYQAEQIEIGAKYDGGNFGGDLSFFTTDKPSAIQVGNSYEEDGEQRNRGVELTFFGEPLSGLRLLGGASWLDAELERTANGAFDGNDEIGTPQMQANVGVEWDVPGLTGLTLTARAVYTAAQYADRANTLEIPSWTRYDLGARYLIPIGEQVLTLRGRIDNVTDRDYWASAGGYPESGYLVLGAPRTVALTASIDF